MGVYLNGTFVVCYYEPPYYLSRYFWTEIAGSDDETRSDLHDCLPAGATRARLGWVLVNSGYLPWSSGGIVKLFENACGAVDVSGRGDERYWLTASFKPLRR